MGVCKFLQRRDHDLALFFYAMGQQRALHTISDESACKSFQKLAGCLFGEDDIEAMRKRVMRMKVEFQEAQRTEQ